MKGIILAGGTGSRLYPLTKVTNKHLLGVYDKPMIYYPLQSLIDAGIKDVLIISGPGHAKNFINLLNSNKKFNIKLNYKIQNKTGGIAQALSLAEDFVGDDMCTVILGDNIFEDDFSPAVKEIEEQKEGCMIFIKEVQDPNRFGVAELKDDIVIGIKEKPETPKYQMFVVYQKISPCAACVL